MSHVDTSGVRGWIEVASLGIEIIAIAVIIVAIIYGTGEYLYQILPASRRSGLQAYRRYKLRLGRALLLGLEILVAADIVRTVALEPTLQSVGVLGLLVLIRTFLSWSLLVELERRWPWQAMTEADDVTLFEDA